MHLNIPFSGILKLPWPLALRKYSRTPFALHYSDASRMFQGTSSVHFPFISLQSIFPTQGNNYNYSPLKNVAKGTQQIHSLKLTVRTLKIGHPKEKLIFQPSFFRCELLVSGRVTSRNFPDSFRGNSRPQPPGGMSCKLPPRLAALGRGRSTNWLSTYRE